MGVKSVLGKIGKVALKVAPYAAMAIPGVGVPLGMAIGGATSAASKKASGGSWKDALISGGIGAATGAVGGGALKGIGPSSSGLMKVLGGAAGKTAGTGIQGQIGSVLGNAALNKVTGGKTNNSVLGAGARRDNPYIMDDEPGAWGGKAGGSWQDMIGPAIAAARGSSGGRTGSNSPTGRPNTQNFPGAGESTGGQSGIYSGNMRGLGPVMGRRDQNFPNLAESIGAGRQDAIRNQPFRSGYDMITQGPEPADDSQGNAPTEIRNRMPPIFPGGGRRRMN